MKSIPFILSLLLLFGIQSLAAGQSSVRYRGTVEVNYGFSSRAELMSERNGLFVVECNTVHGAVFDDKFFLGLGSGVSFYYFDSFNMVPVFLQLEYDVPKYSKVIPFVGLRSGASVVCHGWSFVEMRSLYSLYAGLQLWDRFRVQLTSSLRDLGAEPGSYSGSFQVGLGYVF